MDQITVGGQKIGSGRSVFFVAELGFNHGGSVQLASQMIVAAAAAGADAVKVQTYKTKDLVLPDSPHSQVIKTGELDLDAHLELKMVAESAGVEFLSTPFSTDSVSLLESVGVRAYKVASMDLTNYTLLERIARTSKPIFISTGMALQEEIVRTLSWLREIGSGPIALLHCVSKYPTPLEDARLDLIPILSKIFEGPIGYSDHVIGNNAAINAVRLGASIVEKHFTLDKRLPGPDHELSATPQEMANLIAAARILEETQVLDSFCDRPDRGFAKDYRRGLYASCTIGAGEKITKNMIIALRPECGALPVGSIDSLVGQKSRRVIGAYQPFTFADLDGE